MLLSSSPRDPDVVGNLRCWNAADDSRGPAVSMTSLSYPLAIDPAWVISAAPGGQAADGRVAAAGPRAPRQ